MIWRFIVWCYNFTFISSSSSLLNYLFVYLILWDHMWRSTFAIQQLLICRWICYLLRTRFKRWSICRISSTDIRAILAFNIWLTNLLLSNIFVVATPSSPIWSIILILCLTNHLLLTIFSTDIDSILINSIILRWFDIRIIKFRYIVTTDILFINGTIRWPNIVFKLAWWRRTTFSLLTCIYQK